ncbi:hypothetical protein QEH56_14610 [Pelagicoccus enzymogenes]|uniref:hypothetical protein n=1 Tax=Pelagicoccus enzymogenes TaxID=2773457 RepID=UPI00280E5DFC|nr:hypothetical protein [Pelagicoccus enzymogenes]MDQ8199395.1 hypothetical protein [Pelagicoccus enzymogenes]
MIDKAYLVASGDLRESANQSCWPAQLEMEAKLTQAFRSMGCMLERAHEAPLGSHGFIASQRQGMDIFRSLDRNAPIVVAESVWQYSHHVLAGLLRHEGPILTVANWSGQWPGLVGVLNLNGCLAKAGVEYSTLWSKAFDDPFFLKHLESWLNGTIIRHDRSHVKRFADANLPEKARDLGVRLAAEAKERMTILGVFDEGCMGMYNAILPDELLFPLGFFKERLSQSALYAGMLEVSDMEARAVFEWILATGMNFEWGSDESSELTERQVLEQCRMYVAACRIGAEYACDAIGIQYQQGLKDLCAASDLVEGLLNNSERPPVTNKNGALIRPGKPFTHFNEVDEAAGVDGVMTQWVHEALRQPAENTLHDLRWGDRYRSGSTDVFVWTFQISGGAPAAHHERGYAGSTGYRQIPMYFPSGGATLSGVAKEGEIIWSRVFVESGELRMDIGRGRALTLPDGETERRRQATTAQWPIMNAVTYGVSRDQMMGSHKANHVQVAYARDEESADLCCYAKAALANSLGIAVSFCGTRANGASF